MSITTSDIAEAFIRAAEIERDNREHVGPKPVRSLNLGYVHSWADKAAWRKEPGDKLVTLDPYADERKAFWERLHSMPSAAELSSSSSRRIRRSCRGSWRPASTWCHGSRRCSGPKG